MFVSLKITSSHRSQWSSCCLLYAFCNTSSKKKRTGLGGGGGCVQFQSGLLCQIKAGLRAINCECWRKDRSSEKIGRIKRDGCAGFTWKQLDRVAKQRCRQVNGEGEERWMGNDREERLTSGREAVWPVVKQLDAAHTAEKCVTGELG